MNNTNLEYRKLLEIIASKYNHEVLYEFEKTALL